MARPYGSFVPLLGGWAVFLFAQSLALWLTVPDLAYDGDTIGVAQFPIGSALLLMDSSFLLLTGYWLMRERRRPEVERTTPPWTLTNWGLLAAALVMFPVIYILLTHGEPDGLTDALGVWGTFLQWVLLNAAVYPWGWRSATTAHRGASA